jgi:hypothetical protein
LAQSSLHIGNPQPEHMYESSTFLKHCNASNSCPDDSFTIRDRPWDYTVFPMGKRDPQGGTLSTRDEHSPLCPFVPIRFGRPFRETSMHELGIKEPTIWATLFTLFGQIMFESTIP